MKKSFAVAGLFASLLLLAFVLYSSYTSYAQATPAIAADTFTANLSFGMTGNADVTLLQQFLTEHSFYSGPITGNFFALTQQGVERFQAANNIAPASGYFGPLSRAKANAIIAATEPESGATNGNGVTSQINELLQEVHALQQQILGQSNVATTTKPTVTVTPSVTPTIDPTVTPTVTVTPSVTTPTAAV